MEFDKINLLAGRQLLNFGDHHFLYHEGNGQYLWILTTPLSIKTMRILKLYAARQ